MILNPRYGIVGLLALPYYVLFEALGPMIEISGYLVTAGASTTAWSTGATPS